MTQAQKVIRAKVGLLEPASNRQFEPALQDDGGTVATAFTGSKSSTIKGASWHCRRSAPQSRSWPTGPDPAIRGGGGRTGWRAAYWRSSNRTGVSFGYRTSQRSAASRSRPLGCAASVSDTTSNTSKKRLKALEAKTAQKAGGAGAHRSPARSAGEDQSRQGNAWRI